MKPPQGVGSIWPDEGTLVGMVHLLPLPGAPAWGGSMQAVVDRAARDADTLASAGFHGLLVENFADDPFFRGSVPAETVAGMTRAIAAVIAEVSIPVGVNVLRNDARSALGVAAATGARFLRVNVHTGSMWTDQGLVHGQAAETLRARAALGVDVAILADVHVKHATPPPGSEIGVAAADAWRRGRADGLIISGTGTGMAVDFADLSRVREAVPDAPIFVGSGAARDAVVRLLEVADGVIVGSSVMRGDVAGAGVDPERAFAFVDAVRG